jgi:universal stress protein E
MLHNHKSILVGLDLDERGSAVSPGSMLATKQAIWLAQDTGASIRFVHSVFQDEYRTPLGGCQGIVHSGLPEAGEAALAEMLHQATHVGLQCELVITEDRPWIEITKMALHGEVDLVLVGKRNKPQADGRRLGTNAIKLLRKCPCPVWVINPAHDLEHKHVLAATDLTAVGDKAVSMGFDLSERMQCQLHVVHAWQMPLSLQMSAGRISNIEHQDQVHQIERDVQEHIQGHLPADALKRIEIHNAMGTPAQVIGEAVAKLSPDLLVMGTISRSGIAGLLIGSTAERMLHAVDCSILAIKPLEFESPVLGKLRSAELTHGESFANQKHAATEQDAPPSARK